MTVNAGALLAPPELPPLDRLAILLDVDGTLLDFAPEPHLVVVPPELVDTLARLRDRVGGALGVITGRPLDQIDSLLPGLPTAVAGEHGGVVRHAPGEAPLRPALAELPAGWLEGARAVVAFHPGALLEPKSRGFVLHFRNAPQSGPALHDALLALVGEQGDQFQILAANMAWELRPRGADKGTGLHAIMGRAPFAGRLPVFVGDDVTDEDAIHAARTIGGYGFLVPDIFGSPTAVRRWLAQLLEGAR